MMRRILVIVATLALAALSWRDAARSYWQNQALVALARGDLPLPVPLLAADPRLATLLANAKLTSEPTARIPGAENAARAALASDPLDPAAVFVLGMVAEQRGAGAGLPAFELVETMSRREIGNELMLERAAAMRGDAVAAVAHLNRALLVSPQLAAALLPSITPTLADPTIRALFKAHAGRPWYPDLVAAALTGSPTIAIPLDLFDPARNLQPGEIVAGLRAQLAERAVAANDTGGLAALLTTYPAGQQAAARQFAPSPSSTDPLLAPFAWTFAHDEIKSAQLAPSGSIAITIASERVAVVAERLTLLGPGRYRLGHRVSYESGSPRAALGWTVTCVGLDSVAWRQRVSASSSGQRWSLELDVPQNCPAQRWRLEATGDSAQTGSSVDIADVTLEAIR